LIKNLESDPSAQYNIPPQSEKALLGFQDTAKIREVVEELFSRLTFCMVASNLMKSTQSEFCTKKSNFLQ